MNAALAIVRADARAIGRDLVAVGSIALSLLGVLAIVALGLHQDRLPGWAAWFPFMLALSLVGGPGGFGFLFGLLMVDEGDSGVRDALLVSPVPATLFMTVRTIICTAWMTIWPITSVYAMNWAWRGVDLSLGQWMAVITPLALLTPAVALAIPALAADKVAALAVFKGLSFVSLAPLALFFVPGDAWVRWLLLVSPTGWVVESLRAFLDRTPAEGYAWSMGAGLYALTLVVFVIRHFRRKVYRLDG